MKTDRRTFLGSAAATAAVASMSPAALFAQNHRRTAKPDYALTIEPCKLEIAPRIFVPTLAYNGQVPGPVLRLRQGIPATIDVTNKSSAAEIVHWHGLKVDTINDGAMEEGSPMISPGAHRRYSFVPQPAGTRWYHTHTNVGADLTRGAYTGQFGFLIVEGGTPLPQHDREFLLAVHHWEPSFVPMASMMQEQSANRPATPGSDVAYRYATINGHTLGAGEPLRVKKGERVLLHLLNASATENVILALPGHTFEVVAMDGNPVPRPQRVEVLSLAVAERIDAIVQMDEPGVWVLGSTSARSRAMGLGIAVEYVGCNGAPVWRDPSPSIWDYSIFANETPAPPPDQALPLTFADIGPRSGEHFDRWTVNDKSWPDTDPIFVKQGRRYRLIFRNASADQHPMHLHRHSFEVVQIGRKKMSGLIKDTVNVLPLETVAVDFLADNPGDSLLHCHMQLHMDFGFMQLIRYSTG